MVVVGGLVVGGSLDRRLRVAHGDAHTSQTYHRQVVPAVAAGHQVGGRQALGPQQDFQRGYDVNGYSVRANR